jgi:hypothetical protein
MAKWRFELQETFYHTYEIEIPDDISNEDSVDDYFYELSEEEQKKGLVNSESFSWEITETKQIG